MRVAESDCETAAMSKIVAAALVFVCSAAVLMLEILAGRLLAAVRRNQSRDLHIDHRHRARRHRGGRVGWRPARRSVDPKRLLPPTVCFGGVLALCTVPIVRALGDQSGQGGRDTTLLLTFTGFFSPQSC